MAEVLSNEKEHQRHVFAKTLLTLVLIVGGLSSYVSTAIAQGKYREVTSDAIATGIEHTHLKGIKDSLRIHVVKANLLNPAVYIESAHAGQSVFGRKKTSSIARNNYENKDSVIVAINADFFDLKTGENENNQVKNGSILRGTPMTDSPHDVFDNIHSQFALTQNNKPHIGRFRLEGIVMLQGDTLQIDRINSSTDSSSLVLYNNYYGSYSPAFDGKNGMSLVLQKFKTRSDTTYYLVQRKALKGRQPIPSKGAVLSGFGESFLRLQKFSDVGDTLLSVMGFTPDIGLIKTLVGGWPRIVRDGKNIAEQADSVEGTFPDFSKTRHPRAGIGFSRDSTDVYFITVDGRQQSSVGMTLVEFANFMLSQGVYQGLNLDGGGSTTMVVNGRVVNSPSDKAGERPVGNALLFYLRN